MLRIKAIIFHCRLGRRGRKVFPTGQDCLTGKTVVSKSVLHDVVLKTNINIREGTVPISGEVRNDFLEDKVIQGFYFIRD